MSDELSGGELISAEEPIIHLTENGIEGFEILCRLCANSSDHLISIYSEEGVTNDLAEKMNLYLPVKVNKSDILPLQCCFQCASTVLAWHELVVASVEADRRLRDIQFEVEKQLAGDELPDEVTVPSTSQTNEVEQNGQQEPEYDELWSENQLYFCDICPFISQHKTKFDDHICKPKIPNESNDQTPTSSNKTDATKQKHREESGVTTNIKQPTSLELIKTANSHNKTESTWIDNPDVIISIICDECDSEFKTINELAAHKESHKPAKQTPCDIKLKTDSDKKSHDVSKPAAKNESAETLQRNCQICDKIFMKLAHLKVHIRTHILDKYCYVCCNSYNSQLKLDQHKSQHTEADLTQYKTNPAFVQCTYCVEKFCSKLKLYDHCRTHDYGEYACNKCPKKFNNYRSLNAHKGSHNILYKCKECDKLFAVKQTLFQHLRTHQEKSFECNICNKKFRYRNNLKEHETMHNMLKKYKCDICKQRFARLNYLKTHLRIHFNDKPVACEYCACTFTQISVKNTHVRSKHRVCTVCNQIVGDSLQLRVHMWKNHPDNDHADDIEYIG